MLRKPWTIVLLVGLALLTGRWARAQDRIKLKSDPSKPLTGTIQKESPAGIRIALKGGSRMVPAGDILDVFYDVGGEIKLGNYLPALNSEARIDAQATKDRRKALLEALIAYRDLARKAGEKKSRTKYDLLQRQAAFKTALLEARLAEEFDGATTDAINKLKAFKRDYPDGWQITTAATMLAQFLVGSRQYDEAVKVYQDLAALPSLSADMRRHFQVQAAQVLVRPGKYADALTQLRTIIDKMPSDSIQRIRAQLLLAVCQAEMNLAGLKDDASLKDRAAAVKDPQAKIQKILDANQTDKELRALAYNALGHCDFEAKQYKQALWNFLRVDVVYHQNKDEHAEALYYLTKLFTHLKDKRHAQECQDRLASKLFAGTDWQRRLLKDKSDKGNKE